MNLASGSNKPKFQLNFNKQKMGLGPIESVLTFKLKEMERTTSTV